MSRADAATFSRSTTGGEQQERAVDALAADELRRLGIRHSR
jgi:hypothetical protein